MSSIFRKTNENTDAPNRNVFDLTFTNQLSTNYGKIVPVSIQPVMPGDSAKITPKFAFRWLPQVFPIQTRQRVSLKYFYVRNRNLWSGWKDFIGKTKKDLVMPYIKFGAKHQEQLRPCSLYDYMGIPIKIKANGLIPNKTLHATVPIAYAGGTFAWLNGQLISNVRSIAATKVSYPVKSTYYTTQSAEGDNAIKNVLLSDFYGGTYPFKTPLGRPKVFDYTNETVPSGYFGYTPQQFGRFITPFIPQGQFTVNCTNGGRGFLIVETTSGDVVCMPFKGGTNTINVKNITFSKVSGYSNSTLSWTSVKTDIRAILGYCNLTKNALASFNLTLVLNLESDTPHFWGDIDRRDIPFASDLNPDGIRINALRFRGYEAIYNALIRNAENNPFLINGVPEYNKYLLNDGDGADDMEYKLYNCNWADDRFTTALPSPQQGDAPLVGLTGVNGATINVANEDGTQSTLHMQVDEDGKVMLIDNISSNTPAGLSEAMMSAVEYGITINDLRNVNSYQRWLENNIKKGYKYRDQMKSHYGVSVRYDVLDMPEFIGGVSRDVFCHEVTQTVETETGNLGDYAGQSSVRCEDSQSITQYCDEHGYIIGIMSISPVPFYEDVINKDLLKTQLFDYYFPEFGHIGMQPVLNKELAFSQSFLSQKSDEVFGYQRAFYEYLENLDEIHGLYHSDFRPFILGRQFGNLPELGNDFLTVDNQDLNNTFYVDDNTDKILGEIHHEITMKRPIPLYGDPKLQ